ncbi:MAG: sulfatase-like hydrolase/transferase [Planctomycetota bacterium]
MRPRNTILLTIDGLRAAALGAYGNTWHPTPALDQLACGSVLVEWAFAETADPLTIHRQLADLLPPADWRQVVTDDPAAAETLTQNPSNASRFDSVLQLETPAPAAAAEAIPDTALAVAFAGFVEAVEAANLGGASDSKTLWLHTRGLTGPWDAPAEVIARLVDEDDPAPPESTAPAAGRIDRQADPDAVFAAACRYAAQIAVLDTCLGQLVATIDQQDPQRQTQLVLLGVRGYPLGEHGRVGMPEAGAYAESRHVPLLVRDHRRTPGRRFAAAPITLLAALSAVAKADRLHDDGIEQALAAHASATVVLHGQKPAARSMDWCLVAGSDANSSNAAAPGGRGADNHELYAKPDDRWEANNVASVRPGVVEAMAALLAAEAARDG